jgi:hypothetical protein
VYFYDIFKNLIMKTKDILLVGAGATIIYLLWRRSKKAKDTKGLGALNETTDGANTGGAMTGMGMNSGRPFTNAMPLQGGLVTNIPLVSTKPEKIYPLELPPNMDLPNLTGGTGVPTEVAVQQGGVLTTPIVKFPDRLITKSEDVLPASSDEYLNNIIKTEQFGNSGKNLGIERATLSANGMNTRGRVINGTLFRGVM